MADFFDLGTDASFNPRFAPIGPRSVFTSRSNGELTFNFGWLRDDGDPFSEAAVDLVRRLCRIEALGLAAEDAERYVLRHKDVWVPQVDAIITAIRDALGHPRE